MYTAVLGDIYFVLAQSSLNNSFQLLAKDCQEGSSDVERVNFEDASPSCSLFYVTSRRMYTLPLFIEEIYLHYTVFFSPITAASIIIIYYELMSKTS